MSDAAFALLVLAVGLIAAGGIALVAFEGAQDHPRVGHIYAAAGVTVALIVGLIVLAILT